MMLLTLPSSGVVCLCLPGLGGTDKRFLPFSCWNNSCSLGTEKGHAPQKDLFTYSQHHYHQYVEADLLFQYCNISHRLCFFITSDSRTVCNCWVETWPQDCRRAWNFSIQLRSSASSIFTHKYNCKPKTVSLNSGKYKPTSFWAKRSSIFSSRVLLKVSVLREVRRSSMAK